MDSSNDYGDDDYYNKSLAQQWDQTPQVPRAPEPPPPQTSQPPSFEGLRQRYNAVKQKPNLGSSAASAEPGPLPNSRYGSNNVDSDERVPGVPASHEQSRWFAYRQLAETAALEFINWFTVSVVARLSTYYASDSTTARIYFNAIKEQRAQPLWLAELAPRIAKWMISIGMICVVVLVSIYFSYLYFAEYDDSIVQKPTPLRRQDAALFARSYLNYKSPAQRVQALVSGTGSASTVGGVPTTIRSEWVDNDGNGLHDDFDTAMENAEMDASAQHQTSFLPTADNKPAPLVLLPVAPPSTSVCGSIVQFDNKERVLRNRRGCFDQIKRDLDKHFGSGQLLDEMEMTKAETAEKLRQLRQRQAERYRYEAVALAGNMQQLCLCGPHFNIANRAVYFGYEGRNTTLALDFQLHPLHPEDDPMSVTQYSLPTHMVDLHSKITEADTDLFATVKRIRNVRHPSVGVRVSYKTEPSLENMREYYGPTYGPPMRAMMTAKGLEIQNSLQSEDLIGRKHGIFFGYVHSLGHAINQYFDPDSIERKAHDHILLKRFNITAQKIHAAKIAERERAAQDGVTQFLSSLGSQPAPAASSIGPPRLIEHKDVLVGHPFASCFVRCASLYDALEKRRYEWNVYDRGGPAPASDAPDEFLFPYAPPPRANHPQ